MSDAILVVNAGSSSLKCALHATSDPARRLARMRIERIGTAPLYHPPEGPAQPLPAQAGASHAELLDWLMGRIAADFPGLRIVAAGHRVVHGGREFAGPVRVTAGVLAGLDRLAPLAPAHQPHNLAGIRALARARPGLPQVACFDTAFHRTQPRLAQLFALPRALSDEGILRYGFHGLSYEYIASVLPAHLGPAAEGRVLVAHLGGGASMCALVGRRSVATTMGFTALDGLMMGTRSGAIDPGVLLHLMRERGMGADALEELLGRRSGLLGVSGLSDDMRDLLASAAPEAREAVALFVYRVVREAGALAAVMGGLDAIVFTGGIGENAAPVRAAILEGCTWAGARLDAALNSTHGPRISAADSAVRALVIPTDEEQVIARHTATLAADPA
jgi:acetate kinase